MSKKVLHILSGLDRGGVSVVLMNLLKAINKDTIQMDFAVVDRLKGEFEEQAVSLGAKVHHISCSENEVFNGSFSKASFMKQLYKLLKDEKYSAIHCHNNNLTIFSLLVAKLARVKVRIAHSHNIGMQNRSQSIVNRMLIQANRYALNILTTHKIGCSDEAAKFLFGEKSFANSKTQTIYNGIDIKRFESYEENDIKKILFIGRIYDVKNPMFALKVFEGVHNRIPDTTFSIVANVNHDDIKCEQLFNEMEAFVKENHLESAVKFVEPTNEIEKVISGKGILLMPSLAEGLPMVAIESQCANLKCFLSDRVPKEVDCGGCTYLSIDNGVDVWVSAICNYIENPEKLNIDISKFDINEMAEQLERIYLSRS